MSCKITFCLVILIISCPFYMIEGSKKDCSQKMSPKLDFLFVPNCCQTSNQGQTLELTLLSLCNKKQEEQEKQEHENNHYPRFSQRGCPWAMIFCMMPNLVKEIIVSQFHSNS